MPTTTVRPRTAMAAGLAALAVAAGGYATLGETAATAGTVHLTTTANSPSTGQPIAGGGTWIVNRADAYYLGRLLPGSTFDDEYTDGNNWHQGRAGGVVDMCGWVMPGSMGAGQGTTSDTCSSATVQAMAHRLTVGRDFNAKAHEATDGTGVPADTSCTLFYNYFHGSDFSANGGHWATPATGSPAATVQYRFTTRDGGAVVVRDPVLGWGFLPTHCVTRPAALFNDDD